MMKWQQRMILKYLLYYQVLLSNVKYFTYFTRATLLYLYVAADSTSRILGYEYPSKVR